MFSQKYGSLSTKMNGACWFLQMHNR